MFAEDAIFGTPYREKLDVIMDGEPFILGLPDGDAYRAALAALRSVVQRADLAMLAADVTARTEAMVAAAPGRIDVVEMVRTVAFDFVAHYLGLTAPVGPELYRWGTRLFEYQFVGSDAPLKVEVSEMAPLMRGHIQQEIDRCRAAPAGRNDVIARCMAAQAAGKPGFSDAQIVAGMTGILVGGPPQPPMVVPQAMEQLLRRPLALAAAQAAAQSDDDRGLAAHLMEAMRFDPLAPWMPRIALAARTIGGQTIPAGGTVLASIASAMRDERGLPEPKRFDAGRSPDQYIHFGYGVHQCFGLEINRATLHLMIKPLLKRAGLRRARGNAGRLKKRGAFASTLIVEFN
ncbi:cytochrome P450 [Sphingomonas sp. LR60]|uniref:cytochrome P450 n=1 Tax=Sphingomonas sp. LR60 TaxID=3050233 RepID=UPI002FE1A68F